MSRLLDTNVVIELIRRQPPLLLRRLMEHPAGSVALSSITVAELWYGVERSRERGRNQEALDLLLRSFDIAPYGAEVARWYGRIRAGLEARGLSIGPLDLLIAAHAASLDAVLVTNNTVEFARVPELKLEDWTT